MLYSATEVEVGSRTPADRSSRPILLFDRRHPSIPTCAVLRADARSGSQGWPVFGPPLLAARSVLDGREHDGMLGRVGSRSSNSPLSKRENRRTSKNKITLID